nr:hypothetical protein CFP56_54950 [Quercus suber]
MDRRPWVDRRLTGKLSPAIGESRGLRRIGCRTRSPKLRSSRPCDDRRTTRWEEGRTRTQRTRQAFVGQVGVRVERVRIRIVPSLSDDRCAWSRYSTNRAMGSGR